MMCVAKKSPPHRDISCAERKNVVQRDMRACVANFILVKHAYIEMVGALNDDDKRRDQYLE
jgi:hypothetical protein